MKTTLAAIALLFLAACVPTIAPPEDFPQVPAPEPAELQKVTATKTADGYHLDEENFKKEIRNVQELKAEIEALRKVIELYNEWANRRKSND